MILIRDIIFDKNKIFNRNIESLRDNIRDLDLESIKYILREYKSNISDLTRDSRYKRGVFNKDIASIE